MLTVFIQVVKLLFFALIGYVLAKSKIIKSENAGILSKLLVWVFLPCNIFKTFAKNCTITYISENYLLIITSFATIATLAVVMYFVSKLMTKDKYGRRVYEYSLVIPNNGYMGYPMSETLFGGTGLTNAMLFSLPFSLYIYTYGFCILTKRSLSLKKLLNPVVISMALGIAVGLISIPIHDTVYSVFDSLSACMAPVSMLLAGIVISDFDLKSLLTNGGAYATACLRLIVIPFTVGGILKLVSAPSEILATAVLLFSMPCGLNTIVFPKSIDEDCRPGASIALVSSVLSCLTVPLILFIFGLA